MKSPGKSFDDPFCEEMGRDYEGEAYEQGFERGLMDGKPLGYDEGFREGFLAAIPIATELVQIRTRLEQVISHLSSSSKCHDNQNIDRIRHKANLLLSQLQRYRLENIEDTSREITLNSIRIKLKQLSIQAGMGKPSTNIVDVQEDNDNTPRTTSTPSDLSF